jgi:prophage DNA circulation protein|tara:strand:+ start:2925 stop:4091 length:1167 start_codon:yes stop_codon:yes gene_type:complete
MSEETTNPVANVADDGTIKVNLDALQKQSTDEVPVRNEPEVSEEVQPENVEQPVEEPAREEEKPVEAAEPEVQNAENVEKNESVLTEIIEEEVEEAVEAVQEEVADAIEEAQETGQPLPENIQSVVDFMNDTGGTLEDYVKLNTDYASLDENQLLREYYQSSNPNLDTEDISFLMEDKFSFDEEIDDEREVRRKKVARKQALSEAKNHLEGLKSKYYQEVKMGSNLNPEQQKAIEFFNRYNKENEEASKVAKVFNQKTDQVFSDKFEGFDYQVGDKKYRFKVKNADKVKSSQSDINNFVKKFLNEKGEMSDAKGYHKSLFTAMNADQVAKHFYEQGKADAMKDSIERSKNVDMSPRGAHQEYTAANGWKIRAVDGDTSSTKLRVNFKK